MWTQFVVMWRLCNCVALFSCLILLLPCNWQKCAGAQIFIYFIIFYYIFCLQHSLSPECSVFFSLPHLTNTSFTPYHCADYYYFEFAHFFVIHHLVDLSTQLDMTIGHNLNCTDGGGRVDINRAPRPAHRALDMGEFSERISGLRS